MSCLELIFMSLEETDSGQRVSTAVTEDVVVLDVTQLSDVLSTLDPLVSTTFGLQFDGLFFDQVLQCELVRVLFLRLLVVATLEER
jgi:hypothetical protein